MIRNGWAIYFIRRQFGKQRRDMQAAVKQLKQSLPPEQYRIHATVKLYTAMMIAIKERIPEDPFADSFVLQGPLKKYGRVKKMGLPSRYRLFFRAIETERSKAIFVLWLGYPRKEGDKNDCYQAFRRMIENGEFPESLDELLLASEEN
ncbi:type II toxin-antitoxin system YhaV family toxin [Gloeobacter morelensis]|uniref:Type II toxin-antitoxin system YhaV family toxin n=1 Tax=Gloeobacter morelensis MG652769 TaxID=2781736 RepID=A0ABY3PU88_9CYAN|nr:type II toxin-antitoxin system YhaV family toxin [Gloeobacter morelensis MG652769]